MAKSTSDGTRGLIKALIDIQVWVSKVTIGVLALYGTYCLYDDKYNIKTVTRTKYVAVPGFVDPDLPYLGEQKCEGPAPDHPPADE